MSISGHRARVTTNNPRSLPLRNSNVEDNQSPTIPTVSESVPDLTSGMATPPEMRPIGQGMGHYLDAQRTNALLQVDEAAFSWYHVKVCLVAGLGFFTDAYDIFVIDLVISMMDNVYPQLLSRQRSFGIKAATSCGIILGQLFFGWLGDVYGRKRMYGIEMVIMLIGTFGQALAGQAHSVNIFAVITVYRFIMGIGIGGDYPLSSIIPSEFAPIRYRGKMMTVVFSSQGWGQFASALVSIVVFAAFKPELDESRLDFCWRLMIGLGCVPAVISLYFRLTIPETPRFTMDIERNVNQGVRDVENFLQEGDYLIDPDAVIQRVDAPKPSVPDFFSYFSKSRNAATLIGTAWSWFALDIAFYGLNLNTPVVLKTIKFGGGAVCGGTKPSVDDLRRSSIGNCIIILGGLIPGYYFTFYFIERWGRRNIQLMGFTVLSVIFLIIGFGFKVLTNNAPKVLVFFYCLANFFSNFGPNTTTFIIPAETFPTRYRSTAVGISAASGKIGAVLAQVVIFAYQTGDCETNLRTIFIIFAFFMISGIASTYFFVPETKGASLEALSNEVQDGFVRGVANPVSVEEGMVVHPGKMEVRDPTTTRNGIEMRTRRRKRSESIS